MIVSVIASQKIRSWPTHTIGAVAQHVTLADALTRAWPTDTHVAAYEAPAIARRLSSGALLPEPLSELGSKVRMALLIVDVDGPKADGPQAVASWREGERSKLAELLHAHPGLFIYQTRNGYRIVGRLDHPADLLRPEDAPIWKRYYLAALAMLERCYGIVGDRACADWTRIYRLPHATRDQGGKPERLGAIGNPHAIGAWQLELVTDADRAAAEAAAGPSRSTFVPSAPTGPTGPGFVLETLLASRGLLGGDDGNGKRIVLCPWRADHSTDTDGTDSTVLWPPAGGELGKFYCSHQHCADRKARDVLALFTEDDIDRANARPTRAQRDASRAARRPPWPTDQDRPAMRGRAR